jgi:hypothetical protein
MAVTFHDIPASYSPSDNPLRYRFSSNQTGQPNFSYIVETLYDGNVVNTAKVFPEVGIYAHWDASNVVTYIAETPVLYQSLYIDNGLLKNVTIRVTENYGTPPTNQATATATISQTFKGRLSDEDWLDVDFVNDFQELKFLTNNPNRETIILRGVDSYISMLTDNGSLDLEMNFYDENNTLLHTYTTSQNYKIWQLNVKSSLTILRLA